MIAAASAVVAVLAVAVGLRPTPPAREALADREATATAASEPARRVPRLRRRRRRSRASDPAAIAAWCDDLARATRSGATIGTAIRTTTPPRTIAPTVARLTHSLDRGASLSNALARLDTRDPHVAAALTVIRACSESGGPPGQPLDRAAMALRGRATDAADRLTHSAQARASARVLTVLPIGVLALLATTSASVRHTTTTPVGLAVVSSGFVLNAAGWRWMRRLAENTIA